MKKLIFPLAFLVGLTLASLIAVRLAISQISALRSELTQSEKDENILRQKESLLTGLGEDILSQANVVVASLPSRGSSLQVISQLKILALRNGVVLSDIKAGAESMEESDLTKTGILFSAQGETRQILSFLESIKNIAPITLVESVKMDFSGGVVDAKISTKSFWSPLPSELPVLTQPVAAINEDEKKILGKLESLIMPSFSNLAPSAPVSGFSPFRE